MTAWHLNPRNAQAKYTNHGTVKEVFDFFAQYFSGNDLNTLRAEYVTSMKELHDERLDIPVLSVCSVVCVVQMIVVIRKESMVIALDPMRLDFILTRPRELAELARKRFEEFEQLYLFDPCERSITD
jgi:hypothetical protein